MPRVGALGRFAGRVRDNPWLAVAITAGALLVAAWLGWAINVASDKGFNEGLGVLIAVPALVAALALISIPFIAIYLMIRPREEGQEKATTESGAAPEPEEAQASETG